MNASEKLRKWQERVENFDPRNAIYNEPLAIAVKLKEALPFLADLVAAIEREGSGVAVIRALGFVGNSHYCPSCLNTFHDDCGQHKPDCQSLAGMLEDEDWPDFIPLRALTRLQEHLDAVS